MREALQGRANVPAGSGHNVFRRHGESKFSRMQIRWRHLCVAQVSAGTKLYSIHK